MKFIDRNRNRIGGGWPNQKGAREVGEKGRKGPPFFSFGSQRCRGDHVMGYTCCWHDKNSSLSSDLLPAQNNQQPRGNN